MFGRKTKHRLDELTEKVDTALEQLAWVNQFLAQDDDETKTPEVAEVDERMQKSAERFAEGLDNILGYEMGGRKDDG